VFLASISAAVSSCTAMVGLASSVMIGSADRAIKPLASSRAGSNVHFNMKWLDGVYEDNVERPQRKQPLYRTCPPTTAPLTDPADKIADRQPASGAREFWREGQEGSAWPTDGAAPFAGGRQHAS
jgi:hypothetical protein